jgi:predicted metal-binding protein
MIAFIHCTTSPGQDVVMFIAAVLKKENALISQGFSLCYL